MNMNNAKGIKAIESLTASTDLRQAGQLTAFTHQLAKKEFFDEQTHDHQNTLDLDVNLSMSPEYSNDVNSKATRKR